MKKFQCKHAVQVDNFIVAVSHNGERLFITDANFRYREFVCYHRLGFTLIDSILSITNPDPIPSPNTLDITYKTVRASYTPDIVKTPEQCTVTITVPFVLANLRPMSTIPFTLHQVGQYCYRIPSNLKDVLLSYKQRQKAYLMWSVELLDCRCVILQFFVNLCRLDFNNYTDCDDLW